MQTRRFYSPKKTLLGLLVLAVIVVYPYLRATRAPHSYNFGGATMGTTYSVKVRDTVLSERAMRALREQVDALLADVNARMSTYDPDSDISRFNAATQTTAFAVAPELASLTAFALEVAEASGGAFDPTVRPLVELWGFGAAPSRDAPPAAEAIAAARARTDYKAIRATPSGWLRKRNAADSLDLSAVAKGYAADAVARLLRERNCVNAFVEIGGEIMASGSSGAGRPWRVSIDVPVAGSRPGEATFQVVELTDAAIATSGDYRNAFTADERTYSHIIDPRTGWPVTNDVAGVSVIAPDCRTADALATALMVLGPGQAQTLLTRYPGAEALIIRRDGARGLQAWRSPGFPELPQVRNGED